MKTVEEIKDEIRQLEQEVKEIQLACDHKWERYNFVIDGECFECVKCKVRKKIW